MNIAVLGINHKSADLTEREHVSRFFAKHFSSNTCDINFPFILLSTCNRSELYFQGEPHIDAPSSLVHLLESWDRQWRRKMYIYFGRDCLFHLAKVTSGLDSALLGETEIQGQVKRVYLEAKERGKLPPAMHYLFQKSLQMGKAMRAHLHFEESLGSYLFKRGLQYYQDLTLRNILFVGASRTNRKVAKYFQMRGCSSLYFANRTHERAEAMATSFSGTVFPFGDYEGPFDLIIFATTAGEPLFTRTDAKKITRGLVIFDLGLPRNVEEPLFSEKIALVNMGMIEKGFSDQPCEKDLQLLDAWVERSYQHYARRSEAMPFSFFS